MLASYEAPARQTDDVQDEWGISDGYFAVDGEWIPTSEETRLKLRAAMGEPRPAAQMWFIRQGRTEPFWNPCDIVLEDGTVLPELDRLPHDLPLGYHRLVPVDGSSPTLLVVHPTACPESPKTWGVAVQTYALWSDRSWGVGDLGDLRALCERLAERGGGAVLTSPLHEPSLVAPVEPSPYYPSTRRAWSPLLLAMGDPPPAELVVDPNMLIDRDAVWTAKLAALRAHFAAAVPGEVPKDHEITDVDRWNAERSLPDGADEQAEARLHRWLQQCIEAQLSSIADTGVALIGDLAVGFAPDGADAEHFADFLAPHARLGAPPDPFNVDGQDWGIPPFVPWRLRAAAYRPFIETIRAVFRGVQGLRVDHVMGLFRQFWIPVDSATGHTGPGAYVQFPADELLAILCLEATRAGVFVIGEDLGTVEPGVREMLAERRIVGTKVLWFEGEPPAAWPQQCLATITTHDLPTITGVFEGVDGDDEMRERLERVAPGALRATDAVEQAHAALLACPAAIRLLAADDLAGAVRRPNLPGTNDHPSWRIHLPVPVDRLLP